MDVHRSRFVPFPAHAITAAAFSRSSDEPLPAGLSQPTLKLALGRANGHIELWNSAQGRWVQETVLPGDNKSVDGLAWTREPDEKDFEGNWILGQHRLFSIASSSAVSEWDLARGQLKKTSTGNFSEVWCFAAQPRKTQTDAAHEGHSQELAAGCGDGTIVLLTTADNDLQFKKFLARVSGKKARCVSITYQSRDRVVAGFQDSTIRIFDTRNSSVVRTMSVGVGIPGAPKNTIVWSVKSLPNGDIVSGDSNGEVVFWDGRSYSLTQRIKGHDSECLDLISSADGKAVFSGSLDGRIAVYRQSTNPTGRKSWAKIHHRRTHSGEVKAMAGFDSSSLSVVISGGADPVAVLTPLRQNGKEKNRVLPTVPQEVPVASARHARLIVSYWDKSISIWRIARRSDVDLYSDSQPPRRLVAKLTLNTKQKIRSVSISDDGRLLAASTSSELKLFHLRRKPDAEALGVRKLALPTSLAALGARVLHFSPDSKWLAIATLENDVQIIRIADVPSDPRHLQVLDKVVELERRKHLHDVQSGFKQYDQSVTRLAFSSDSSVLVASDLAGFLDSWVLQGHEDRTAPAIDVSQTDSKQGDSGGSSDDSSDTDDDVFVFYGQHWTDNPAGHLLPRLDSAALVLTFRPTILPTQTYTTVNGNPGVHATRKNPHAHSHELPLGQYRVWIVTAGHQMYEFEVLAGKLSEWSRNNPTAALPEDFTRLRDRVMGAAWDVNPSHERIWLYGPSWMFMLSMTGSLAENRMSRKRRKSSSLGQGAKRQKLLSGAGPKTPLRHREGLPESAKRCDDGAWTDALDMAVTSEGDALLNEVDEENGRLDLERVERTQGEDQLTTGNSTFSQGRTWWCTFKYRPILGMVPILDDANMDEMKPLEVVIVERPSWDK